MGLSKDDGKVVVREWSEWQEFTGPEWRRQTLDGELEEVTLVDPTIPAIGTEDL